MNWNEVIAQLGVSGIAVVGFAIAARAYYLRTENEIAWLRDQIRTLEARLLEVEKRTNS